MTAAHAVLPPVTASGSGARASVALAVVVGLVVLGLGLISPCAVAG